MAKKPNVTVDLTSVQKRIKATREKLKEGKVGQEIVVWITSKIRTESENLKTGRKFQDLADVTPRGRRYLAKYNKTHKNYSENEPNLTITGKFLDSIKAKVTASKKSIKWVIDVSGTHPGYKTGGERTKRIKNKELRRHLASIGRDPLDLSEKILKAISIQIERKTREVLKKV